MNVLFDDENRYPVGTVRHIPDGYSVYVKADAEHVRKIGQDLIAEHKARLEGIA